MVYASLARIADLETVPFEIEKVGHEHWMTGDYVVATVVGETSELYRVEDCTGDTKPVAPGTIVVGALGERAATLEGVGTWRDVVDGKLHALTSAGLFGVFSSFPAWYLTPMCLEYDGHVLRHGEPVRMQDFAIQQAEGQFSVPTILIVGTSMSAGKTVTGKAVCKLLAEAGHRVIGIKLTGAGRYRDIIAFRKSGAHEIYDFVDAGLPSTKVREKRFRDAIRPLLRHIGTRQADFVVCEAGASPLEPYNGAAAIDELGDNVVCTLLAASDPYAVVGVIEAFGLTPDLVTGPATNTSAALDLVYKLSGLSGINVIDPDEEPAFRKFLLDKLAGVH